MFVKPAPGKKIRDPRDPRRAYLPESGREVPEETYWIRRLVDGDILVVEFDQIPDSEEVAAESTETKEQ